MIAITGSRETRAEGIMRETAQEYQSEFESGSDLDALLADSDDESTDELSWHSIGAQGDEIAQIMRVNLAQIPEIEWNNLKISTTSRFGDDQWRFDDMGSEMYRTNTNSSWGDSKMTEEGIHLLQPYNGKRLRIARALTLYALPHNNVFLHTNSYNSVRTRISTAKHLARILATHHLYDGPEDADQFITVNDINPSVILESLRSEASALSGRRNVAELLRLWFNLSQAGLLPPQLALRHNVVDDDTFAQLRLEAARAINPWLPMDLDVLKILMTEAEAFIDRYTDDIIWAYDLFAPLFARDLSHLKIYPGTCVRSGFGWQEAINAMRGHPSPLWDDVLSRPDTALHVMQLIFSARVHACISRLRGACSVLIDAPTGLRISELQHLKVGCAKPVDGGYRLDAQVWKTSVASRGDPKDLPIPALTYKAIKVLERLNAVVQQYQETPYLYFRIRTYRGKSVGGLIHPNALYNHIRSFATYCGVSEPIHPHQFRKTLAMFIIYHDPRHIGLITHLFSHKSYKMTMAYIMSIPGISKDVMHLLIYHNFELAMEIIEACESGKISGKAGLSIAKHLHESRQFPGTLRYDDPRTLKEYIESVITSGSPTLFRRTPYGVICIKEPTMTQRAPCDPPCAPGYRLLEPNIADCDPGNCPFAVYTEDAIPQQQIDIVFYTRLLQNPNCSPKFEAFAKQRIKNSEKHLRNLCRGGTTTSSLSRAPEVLA